MSHGAVARRAIVLCCVLLLPALPALAQQDEVRTPLLLTGSPWQFVGSAGDLPAIGSADFPGQSWTSVPTPHVFQTREHFTEISNAWYRRQVIPPGDWQGKHLYLIFEGAASFADVYINRTFLGEHRGAYTRFVLDATHLLRVGRPNELEVRVDDRKKNMADCLPNSSRLYTVWGGLYRKVWLLAVDPLHIDPTDDSSDGIYLTPANISPKSADLTELVLVRNASTERQSAQVRATLIDPSGAAVASITAEGDFPPLQRTGVELNLRISRPKLWEPATPNLYHVLTEIVRDDQTIDAVTEPTGFRNVVWRDGKVFLNGRQIILAGVSEHQEIESKASAVSDADLRANYSAMQDLGVNFVRLAHYPHARFEYDLCDKLGIFCWAENGHSNRERPTPNGEQLTREMVKQNYNHPSIAIWSVGNEASAGAAQVFVPIVKSLDEIRPVTVANMPCNNADFRCQNVYPGWYGKGIWDFSPTGYISETGGGGVVSIHCDYADAKKDVDHYEPEEYQQLLAEARFQQAFRENGGRLGLFTWWTLRDFTDTKYKGPVGLNTKGLLTYAGDKKDVYYLLRGFLRPQEPTVHICSQRYFLRTGDVNNGIKAYSNAAKLSLTINGQTISTLSNGDYAQSNGHHVDNVFYWKAPLSRGKNVIEVSDGAGHDDQAVIYFYGVANISPYHDAPIKNLRTTNPQNAAYYMDMPVKPQWPIYYDLDGTADNSFDEIPSAAKGAGWIALGRLTKPHMAAGVQFTLTRPATILVMCTKGDKNPPGFQDITPGELLWRNNELNLVDAQLFSRPAKPGDTIHVPYLGRDAIVLIK